MNCSPLWKAPHCWRGLSIAVLLTAILIITPPVAGQPALDPPVPPRHNTGIDPPETSALAAVIPVSDAHLQVAVSDCPPFIMRDARGELTGIALDLWERIAAELGVTYQLHDYVWEVMFEKVETDAVDVALSCITITAEREKRFDFTHTFHEAPLTVATRKPNLLQDLKSLVFTSDILLILGGLFGVSLLVGRGLWILEHKHNEDIFPKRGPVGTWVETFLCGFMLVTRGPIHYTYWHTLLARVIFVIASFFSTLLVATVTALLASALTAVTLQGQLRTPNDLRNVRVGVFANTIATEYLEQNHIAFTPIRNDKGADYDLVMLARGKFDAVISDKPIFEYFLTQDQGVGQFQDIIIMPWNLQAQHYGFMLPEGCPWREPINRVMLDTLHSAEWQAVLDSYLKY